MVLEQVETRCHSSSWLCYLSQREARIAADVNETIRRTRLERCIMPQPIYLR